ncbi:MAG TPA: efflux RND transporter periplasmic adaptor subunit [Propionibacteriaceae bacterium]|nr:efflux RND transporter periplasmic adaptor subunit [Propionibacteriaceae bacterium]
MAIVAAVTLIVLAGAGFLVWRLTRPATTAAATTTTTTVKATKTTQRTAVSATGTLAPQNQAYLNFPAAGTVATVNVTLGQTVTAGQVLATEDTTSLSSAVTSAQAAVDSAQSSLDTLNSSSSATSAQISAAKAQLASAQAKLSSAQNDLAGATMTAPFAGVVAQVNLTANSKVNGTTSTTTGPGTTTTVSSATSAAAQIVVVDTRTWLVNATVGMADLASLKQGLACTVTPTGSTTSVAGTLTSIGIVGTTTSGTTSYPVIVTLTGTPTGLYIGGSADVSIVVSEVTALTVPTAAVQQENGQTYVTVVANGVHTRTNVTVGRTFGARTEITSGLAENDEVLVTVPVAASGSSSRGPYGGRSGFPSGARPSGFGGGGSGANAVPSTLPTAQGS